MYRAAILLFAVSCGHTRHAPVDDSTGPDAAAPSVDASTFGGSAGASCPDGVTASIAYPPDGATGVPLSITVPITVEGRVANSSVSGTLFQQMPDTALVVFDDASCSTQPPYANPTAWSECFTSLEPNQTYNYTVELMCPGWLDQELAIATTTFTTAAQ